MHDASDFTQHETRLISAHDSAASAWKLPGSTAVRPHMCQTAVHLCDMINGSSCTILMQADALLTKLRGWSGGG